MGVGAASVLRRQVEFPTRAGWLVRRGEQAVAVVGQVERVGGAGEAEVLGGRLLAGGEALAELREVVIAVGTLGILVALSDAPDRLAARVGHRGEPDLLELLFFLE